MLLLDDTTASQRPVPQPPPGMRMCPAATAGISVRVHRFLVLFLTFAAYASFHASRKPPSIVKAVLTGPATQTLVTDATPFRSATNGTGWAPFDGPHGPHRLGELDLSFLLAYAFGMYFAGHLGDTVDLRILLTGGMLGSGFFVILFGLCYFLDVHYFGAFLVVQVLCGLFQSIGWPCVVAVVGNWFGKSKRGLIMGVWSSHTSLGNIIGSLVASSVLGYGWGWSFVLPGVLILVVAIFVFLFLVVHPENVEIEMSEIVEVDETNIETVALVDPDSENVERGDGNPIETEDGNPSESRDGARSGAVGFLAAWRLDNVASYALCLFFSKFVAYTFLYWLPFYLKETAVAGEHISHKFAGMLSTIFDVGGVLGGIAAGYLSDMIDARGVTSFLFLLLSIPSLFCYRFYGSISMFTNIALMLASGMLVNGPYSLITTAVAADIGSQGGISGNSRAIATVTAIIDGTGSVGAAFGPLLTGYIQTRGWNSVFVMLYIAIFLAACFLFKIVKREIREKNGKGRWLWLGSIAK